MNAHNTSTIELLSSEGFKRTTLARELAVGAISALSNATSMEIEVFVHGALCFSYSGQCLFSSFVGGRSGNRGLCPQACRLPYELYHEGRKMETPGAHILSTQDLCAIGMLGELADAGVSSLKIEGPPLNRRSMSRPSPRSNRKALDGLGSAGAESERRGYGRPALRLQPGFTTGISRESKTSA